MINKTVDNLSAEWFARTMALLDAPTVEAFVTRPLPSYVPGATCWTAPGVRFATDALLRVGATPFAGPPHRVSGTLAAGGRIVDVDLSSIPVFQHVSAIVAAYRWLLSTVPAHRIALTTDGTSEPIFDQVVAQLRFAGDPLPHRISEGGTM